MSRFEHAFSGRLILNCAPPNGWSGGVQAALHAFGSGRRRIPRLLVMCSLLTGLWALNEGLPCRSMGCFASSPQVAGRREERRPTLW